MTRTLPALLAAALLATLALFGAPPAADAQTPVDALVDCADPFWTASPACAPDAAPRPVPPAETPIDHLVDCPYDVVGDENRYTRGDLFFDVYCSQFATSGLYTGPVVPSFSFPLVPDAGPFEEFYWHLAGVR